MPAPLSWGDAAFHPDGLALAFQLLHPLPGGTLQLKFAPSPCLPFPLLCAPKSTSSSFTVLGTGALQGLGHLLSVPCLKAEPQVLLGTGWDLQVGALVP